MSQKTRAIDSLVSFRNSQGANVRGTITHVGRNQVLFEVYNPYSIVQLSEVLSDLKLIRGERVLYDGRAVVSNIVATGLMLIVSATLVDPWSDLSSAAPGSGLREEVEQFVQDFDAANAIAPSYQLTVTRLGSFLTELNRWLNQTEAASDVTGRPPEREFTLEVEAGAAPRLGEMFADFEREASQIGGEELIHHKAFARGQLHPLMLVSPFIHRTFTKPLGYAGDYEMVNMIAADPLKGQTTYAQILNSLILKSDGAQAHRNRIDRLQTYLHGEAQRVMALRRPLRVLNIGCGPAHELQRFIRQDPLADKCEFHLMDFNDETLAHTRRKLTEAAFEASRNPHVVYHHKSINELLKDAARGALGRETAPFIAADLIYCAGLFDYLNDKICSRLLNLFCSWANPGGLVVATNVTPKNSVRYFLEHLLEWNLIYRDEQDMDRLAPPRGERVVNCDPTNVNVFLEIRVPDQPLAP